MQPGSELPTQVTHYALCTSHPPVQGAWLLQWQHLASFAGPFPWILENLCSGPYTFLRPERWRLSDGVTHILGWCPESYEETRRDKKALMDCADGDGKLTGGDAVKFFERSGLPRDLLAKVGMHAGACPVDHRGIAAAFSHFQSSCDQPWHALASAQVWSLSDSARRGFLDVRTFSKASRKHLFLGSSGSYHRIGTRVSFMQGP